MEMSTQHKYIRTFVGIAHFTVYRYLYYEQRLLDSVVQEQRTLWLMYSVYTPFSSWRCEPVTVKVQRKPAGQIFSAEYTNTRKNTDIG